MWSGRSAKSLRPIIEEKDIAGMSEQQVLQLEGVHNFRDYGGYALTGGGRLKRGLLWRSGQHNGATDADLAVIADLGLASVFDLRTSRERNRYPCRRPEPFGAAVHFSDDPSRPKVAPHIEAAARSGEGGAEAVRELMRDTYRGIAFRPELIAMIGNLAQTLIEGDGPSLVNCMAGKDRTGMSVAAIHLAVGVHRDDVMADYLLTNTAGNIEVRIAAGMGVVSETYSGITEEGARAIMGVEVEYLDTAYKAIDERYGSFDAYLAEGIGIDAAAREKLKDALAEF
jgi:protein tyrosine/serine phosphatase